jgi:hypothetical protein
LGRRAATEKELIKPTSHGWGQGSSGRVPASKSKALSSIPSIWGGSGEKREKKRIKLSQDLVAHTFNPGYLTG